MRNLGVDGVVRLGAEVKPGDILVGKITPKSETELAPEERLLRAIFGEKAADVKDSSLYVQSGKGGIVMDVRIEYAKDPNRQNMTNTERKRQSKHAKDVFKEQKTALVEELTEKLSEILLQQKLPCPIYDTTSAKQDAILISSNRRVTRPSIAKLAAQYDSFRMDDCPTKEAIVKIIDTFRPRFQILEKNRDEQLNALANGVSDETGAIKKVKVYVASKRKLQVGDKMAGRHGNKGIVSRRSFRSRTCRSSRDGTPVDIVLNPLGVPSRMNIGQVLETHLGWAAKMLGIQGWRRRSSTVFRRRRSSSS